MAAVQTEVDECNQLGNCTSWPMAIGDAEANSTAHLAGPQAFRIVQLQYSMTEAAWLGDVLPLAGTGPTIALAHEVSQR